MEEQTMEIKKRVENLRQLMKENKMEAYIIPSSDAHLSEYVSDHFKCREWISGFTGSAGTVVITADDAGLWTDGRYYIQAETELHDSGIRLFKMAAPGVPTYTNWLKDVLKEDSYVGLDGNVFCEAWISCHQGAHRSGHTGMRAPTRTGRVGGRADPAAVAQLANALGLDTRYRTLEPPASGIDMMIT